MQIADLMAEHGVHALLDAECEQLPRQRPEIDVRPGLGPVQPDRIGEVPTLGHQRQPPGEFVLVVDELHGREQRVAHQGLVAPAEVVDVLGALHEADVRDGVEEAANVAHDVVLVGVGPELTGDLELLVDIDRLGDVDGAVGVLRGVVQFAQRRVAGSGVVPRVTALRGGGIEPFHQGDGPIRFDQTQQRTQRRAHDSRSDQYDVGLLRHSVIRHRCCPSSVRPARRRSRRYR